MRTILADHHRDHGPEDRMSGIDRRGEGIRDALAGEQPVPIIGCRTIGEEWASYLGFVVPTGATPVQVEECQRAFYAGAEAMRCALTRALCHPDDATGEAHMDALGREMSDFLRLFKARESV